MQNKYWCCWKIIINGTHWEKCRLYKSEKLSIDELSDN